MFHGLIEIVTNLQYSPNPFSISISDKTLRSTMLLLNYTVMLLLQGFCSNGRQCSPTEVYITIRNFDD